MRTTKQQPNGFTLIELMLVVAVIGLVTAIALPNIQRSRETAVQKQCIANLMEIYKAKQRWGTDNKKLGGDIPLDSELYGANLYIAQEPHCGSGGTYTIGAVQDPPTCNREGHVLH